MKESLFLALANHLPRVAKSDRYRSILLRWAGARIGSKSLIRAPLTIRPIGGAKNIQIGNGVFINTEVIFGVPGDKVIIGNNVLIGPRVMFETTAHGLKHIPEKGRGQWTKPIIVEDEVWIGAGAIILQGVTIKHGSVIAAGAVVTQDVDSYTVVGGVPAKFLRKVGQEDKDTQKQANTSTDIKSKSLN